MIHIADIESITIAITKFEDNFLIASSMIPLNMAAINIHTMGCHHEIMNAKYIVKNNNAKKPIAEIVAIATFSQLELP